MATIDVDQLDMRALSPEDFARLVKDASKADLAEVMAGEHRTRVLDAVFARMSERFRPDRAPSRPSAVHWHLKGRPDGADDHYELMIEDGTCTVSAPPEHEPRVTVTVEGVDFLKLVSGNASATTLFFTRRLILQGDLGLGAGLTDMFDIPKA
ncbi:MAG: SCP2 sterol-binding domain-containing protein [Streptosporangiales bacterium]|nr:SCP2 sterol-binding domain-containing protein [Streptosporangiales bacterium]